MCSSDLIRLDLGPGERIGLRLYDDGHFFAQLLPSLHWDEEALRPLRLFVSRRRQREPPLRETKRRNGRKASSSQCRRGRSWAKKCPSS